MCVCVCVCACVRVCVCMIAFVCACVCVFKQTRLYIMIPRIKYKRVLVMMLFPLHMFYYICYVISMNVVCVCFRDMFENKKRPVFPFLMLSAKQGNKWYKLYNVFGMIRSLTRDKTRNLLYSKSEVYYQAIEDVVICSV